MRSRRAATLQHGLACYRNNSRPLDRAILGRISRRGNQSRTAAAPNWAGHGFGAWRRQHRSGSIRMYGALPCPQNSRGWAGACLQKAVTTKRISRATLRGVSDPGSKEDPRSDREHTSRRGLRDGKDEWRNGSTDASETWFDSMAPLRPGSLLRAEVREYP